MDISTCEHFDMGTFQLGKISAHEHFGMGTFWHGDILAYGHFGILVLLQKGGNPKKEYSCTPINAKRGVLPCIHLEPAMIVSTVVRVVGGYGNKNEGGRDSPTEDNVLQFGKHAILVHNRCHHGIDMQSLQKHEHKTCQEEEMCQNRDNAANLHIAAAACCALKSRQL